MVAPPDPARFENFLIGLNAAAAGAILPLFRREHGLGEEFGEDLIATVDPEACFNADERRAWRSLRGASRLARLGCDVYAYAMVAAGTLDHVVEAGLKRWDIDAAPPLPAGAGAQANDWAGRPIGGNGGQVALAGSAALLEEAPPHLATAARRTP